MYVIRNWSHEDSGQTGPTELQFRFMCTKPEVLDVASRQTDIEAFDGSGEFGCHKKCRYRGEGRVHPKIGLIINSP